jgi:hypothetical protein
MRAILVPMVLAVGVTTLSQSSPPASAKGCLKGAVIGGVAGHFAGHHGLLGAGAGCVIGHHPEQDRFGFRTKAPFALPVSAFSERYTARSTPGFGPSTDAGDCR